MTTSPAMRWISPLMLCCIAVIVVPLVIVGGLHAGSAGASDARCLTTGPLPGLTDVQAQNARVVAAVASARGGGRAAVLALMIGITESGLRILGNPNDPSADGLPSQGIGFDHDSLGIFQQRPSWGTAAQRLDPVTSTNLLLDRVADLPNGVNEEPWVVAQQVQVSAYDGDPRPANNFSNVYGGNYRALLPEATGLAVLIGAQAARTSCVGDGGARTGSGPATARGTYGLPATFVLRASTQAARIAVLAALEQLGKPYVFGAAGPTSFDCSGLMQWAWAKAGVPLPHFTGPQFDAGVPTNRAQLSPGDLVLTPGSDGTLADPGHVGMYIGEGLVVEAPETGDVVKVVSYASFVSEGLSGLRHIG